MEPIEIFARGVWKCVPDESDCSWVQRVSELEATGEPLGDFGPIIKEMLQKGVSPETIARFAKIIGYETAFGICYHLGDSTLSYEDFPPEDEITWGLFQTDPETEQPISDMNGVHEVLLMLDPSGREMRPKNA